MERILLAITLLISAVAPQLYSAGEHWALHTVIPVWIDRQNLPPQGDQLVERAMRTWTTASSGSFTMRRT
jgi:hypothetical protein